MRAIYNITSAMSAELRGARNRAQQMLHLAREHRYIFFTLGNEPASNVLTHIFMCHPEAVKMYRAYPYVALIDSTYLTNQYKMPLVEIIGVTPVGKNFLIAYALMANENVESYKWLLNQLKNLLPEGVVPTTIVTDRELGLLAAIPVVFPNAHHLLCTFHIYRAVEAYALWKTHNSGLAHTCAYGMFKKILKAVSVEECETAWQNFRESYANRQVIVTYVARTWIPHIRKWAKCYTNDVLHFKNTATSRVESAHAVYKSWICSSTVACDSLWQRGHKMMEGQHASLRKLLSDSMGKTLVLAGPHARLFSLLPGKVSHLAIKYMCKEYDRGVTLGDGLDDLCGCWFLTSRGLLCACRLHYLHYSERKVHFDDIHVFWRTLVYGDGAVAVFDRSDDMEEMFEEIRGLDPSMFRSVRDAFDRQLHPEREDVEEPEVVENRRGRPRTSTTRNLSGVEHARRRFSGRPRTAATTSTVNYPSGPGAPLERAFITTDLATFPNRSLLPAWFRQFYDSYFNPLGDGHCGFRCLSHAVHGEDSNWGGMRRALSEEIQRRPGYKTLYHDTWGATPGRIFWPLDVATSEAHWMWGVDLYAYATMYCWTICVVSSRVVGGVRVWDNSCTYLPIHAPPGVTAPLGELWLLHDGFHWRRLRVKNGTPMPPFNILWDTRDDHDVPVHDDSVTTWKDSYIGRTATWAAHEGH